MKRAGLLLSLLLTAVGTPASAASIAVGLAGGPPGAPPRSASVAADESVGIDLYLDLAGDAASGFEGAFLYAFSGSWSVSVDSCGGASWTGAVCNGLADRANLSLTSDESGGARLLVTLTVTRNGNAPGDFFGVSLGAGAFAFRDLDEPPFTEDVPIDTPAGAVLARLVPEPGSLALLAVPSLGLAASARQRRRSG